MVTGKSVNPISLFRPSAIPVSQVHTYTIQNQNLHLT